MRQGKKPSSFRALTTRSDYRRDVSHAGTSTMWHECRKQTYSVRINWYNAALSANSDVLVKHLKKSFYVFPSRWVRWEDSSSGDIKVKGEIWTSVRSLFLLGWSEELSGSFWNLGSLRTFRFLSLFIPTSSGLQGKTSSFKTLDFNVGSKVRGKGVFRVYRKLLCGCWRWRSTSFPW